MLKMTKEVAPEPSSTNQQDNIKNLLVNATPMFDGNNSTF